MSNLTLVIDGEEIPVDSFSYSVELESEVRMVAEEYELIETGGIPMVVPKGPRKPKTVSHGKTAYGTIEGVTNTDFVKSPERHAIEYPREDIELEAVIFTNVDTNIVRGEATKYALDFTGLLPQD